MALKIEKFEGVKTGDTDTNQFWRTVGKLKVGERVFYPTKTVNRGVVSSGIQALREVTDVHCRSGVEDGRVFVYRV
jgi:hypothetical protein